MTVASDQRRVVPRVWCINLEIAGPNLLALEQETPRLAEEDRVRASRLVNAAHRQEWSAAHVALRLVVERVAGTSARGVVFSRSANGKPFLPDAGIDFSLSHAARHALIAISDRAPIGVDLEGMREIRMEKGRRAAIEAAGEALAVDALPAAASAGRFLQAWVRLEALAKAEGIGMARVLSKAGAYGPRRGMAVDEQILPGGVRVLDLALGPELYGAVALSSTADGVQLGYMPTDLDGLRRFPSQRLD